MPVQIKGALRNLALSAFAVGATATFSACVTVHDHGYHAGGYYADPHDEYEYGYPGDPPLIYHSDLGVYFVDGYHDHYFHDGYFYRWHAGYWNRSRYWGRAWERCDARYLPRPIHHVSDNYYARGHRPHQDGNRGGRNHQGRAQDHRGYAEARGERHDRGDQRGPLNFERERSERGAHSSSGREPVHGRTDRSAHDVRSDEPRGSADRGLARRGHQTDRDRPHEQRAEPTRVQRSAEQHRPERRVAEREAPRAGEDSGSEPSTPPQQRQHGGRHHKDGSGSKSQAQDSSPVDDQPGHGRSHRARTEH